MLSCLSMSKNAASRTAKAPLRSSAIWLVLFACIPVAFSTGTELCALQGDTVPVQLAFTDLGASGTFSASVDSAVVSISPNSSTADGSGNATITATVNTATLSGTSTFTVTVTKSDNTNVTSSFALTTIKPMLAWTLSSQGSAISGQADVVSYSLTILNNVTLPTGLTCPNPVLNFTVSVAQNSSDPSWLSSTIPASPVTGSLDPSKNSTAMFKGTGLNLSAGSYSAIANISSTDSAIPEQLVTVGLNVAEDPYKSWVTVSRSFINFTCPILEASLDVLINNTLGTDTLNSTVTVSGGWFTTSLSASNSTAVNVGTGGVRIQFSRKDDMPNPGHNYTFTITVDLSSGNFKRSYNYSLTVWEDFCPYFETTTTSISSCVVRGSVHTESLSVHNAGSDVLMVLPEYIPAVAWATVNPTYDLTNVSSSSVFTLSFNSSALNGTVGMTTLNFTTNDYHNRTYGIPVTFYVAELPLSSASLSRYFLELEQNSTATTLFTIKNTIANDTSITCSPSLNWTVSMDSVGWLSTTSALSGSLAPSANYSVVLLVNATGLAYGTYTAVINATTNDVAAPLESFQLLLSVGDLMPILNISAIPTSIDLTVPTGQNVTYTYQIQNIGNATLGFNISNAVTTSVTNVTVSLSSTGGSLSERTETPVAVDFVAWQAPPGVVQVVVSINGTDSMTVTSNLKLTIADRPPVVVAVVSPLPYVPLNATSFYLDGSNSTDEDGTIVSYRWTQVSQTGVPLTISNNASAFATVTWPSSAYGYFNFTLACTDNDNTTVESSPVMVLIPPGGVQMGLHVAGNHTEFVASFGSSLPSILAARLNVSASQIVGLSITESASSAVSYTVVTTDPNQAAIITASTTSLATGLSTDFSRTVAVTQATAVTRPTYVAPTPTPNPPSNPEQKKLSGGAIFGIFLLVLVGVVGLGYGFIWLRNRTRLHKHKPVPQEFELPNVQDHDSDYADEGTELRI